jgi:hypothetical protein
MTDRLAWFAMGAVFSLVLCGWPWHPRFRPYSRRGSNPPPPGRKPAPPAGPPCNGGEITLAQWEAMRTHFTEGRVQRGNGNGGPSTEKPQIVAKPKPHGGRLLKPWE